MPFVERKAGAIVGAYALPQQGRAVEFVPDASPDLVAFNRSVDDAALNAHLKAEMAAADIAIVRALVEGDQARIDAHKVEQAARRARLKVGL